MEAFGREIFTLEQGQLCRANSLGVLKPLNFGTNRIFTSMVHFLLVKALQLIPAPVTKASKNEHIQGHFPNQSSRRYKLMLKANTCSGEF